MPCLLLIRVKSTAEKSRVVYRILMILIIFISHPFSLKKINMNYVYNFSTMLDEYVTRKYCSILYSSVKLPR